MALLRSRLSFLLASFACFTLLSGTRAENLLDSRQLKSNGVPSDNNYLNRVLHSTIILGDFLYIDGGEIAFLDEEGEGDQLPVTDTYSISLKESWTNKTVTFNRIQKAAPVFNYGMLWPDGRGQSFYAWGGEVSEILARSSRPPLARNSVWRCDAEANGGGSWEELKNMPQNAGFAGLTRPAGALSAYGQSTGWFLGGFESKLTSNETSELSGVRPVPGLVSFNSENDEWLNRTATGYSFFGNAIYGQMEYVPNIGSAGILIAMGGQTSKPTRFVDTDDLTLTFANINMYDIGGQRWLNQTATGAIPTIRSQFCSVGAAGDDGTYEIFIYGGHPWSRLWSSYDEEERKQQFALDEVYVLSLPSFSWTKADYASEHPRTRHRCNIRGRQMIITGGLDPTRENDTAVTYGKDIWTQGIGIFDLTALQWRDGYDATTQPYQTPSSVKSGYDRNGRYPARWDDPAVEQLMTGPEAFPKSRTQSKKNKTGAIVGGIIGGILFIIVIPVSVWYFRRRRRTKPATSGLSSKEEKADSHSGDSAIPAYGNASEADPSAERRELEGSHLRPGELDASGSRSELKGDHSRPVELGQPISRSEAMGSSVPMWNSNQSATGRSELP